MSMKYYNAHRKYKPSTLKEQYQQDYNSIVDFTFDNAFNVFYDEIFYETSYGSRKFKKINRVRVDSVVIYNTGIIPADDFKVFIFPPEFKIKPYYGMKFKWKNDYWLVISTNVQESLANTAEVRRCNNVLRFFDERGEKVYEPCIMDYTLRFANNNTTAPITIGNGEQKIWCQRNDKTLFIKANDRFLFGHPKQRFCFRLYGGGGKNYMNTETMDDNSPTLTEFYVQHYQVNPLLDDFENGFADAYFNEIKIAISNTATTMNVGDTIQLIATVHKGDSIIDDEIVIWNSNNSNISVDVLGKITANSIGSATIKATINGADSIYTSIDIEVTEDVVADKYEILVNPQENYVLQNQNRSFDIYLYKNGVKQSDVMIFTDVTKNVPTNKYDVIVDNNNSFTLFNKGMYMDKPVIIRCSCGQFSKDLSLWLRGVY